ncbi:MAG: hypothetical protein IPH84_10695 [Bacteroidales bacterium]|nr:hypothetical protein [Bacteroidales bacterium]
MQSIQPELFDQQEEKWLPFRDARILARRYNIEYKEEWEELMAQPSFLDKIPDNPDHIYRFTGWNGWTDWLVDPARRLQYSRFTDTREFARSLRLKTSDEWLQNLSENRILAGHYNLVIPRLPQHQYKSDGWKDWHDWLGLSIDYKDFETTRKFISTLKLKSKDDWKQFCKTKKPKNIYFYPEIAYRKSEWKGWEYWLGIGLSNTENVMMVVPEREVQCKCMGRLTDCLECDGKGYYQLK